MNSSLHIRANGHRFTIERKHRLSSLYTHLKEHAYDSFLPHYSRSSLGDYILMPIEQIHSSGSDWQDRINRLKRTILWIDILGSIELTGLNKKRSEDILESAVMPFSRTVFNYNK